MSTSEVKVSCPCLFPEHIEAKWGDLCDLLPECQFRKDTAATSGQNLFKNHCRLCLIDILCCGVVVKPLKIILLKYGCSQSF